MTVIDVIGLPSGMPSPAMKLIAVESTALSSSSWPRFTASSHRRSKSGQRLRWA